MPNKYLTVHQNSRGNTSTIKTHLEKHVISWNIELEV